MTLWGRPVCVRIGGCCAARDRLKRGVLSPRGPLSPSPRSLVATWYAGYGQAPSRHPGAHITSSPAAPNAECRELAL